MKGISSYFTGNASSHSKPIESTEITALANIKIEESHRPALNPKEMKAEILSTEKALLKVLEQVKSDPEMMKKILEGLDPTDSLHALTTKLLSEDLTSSKIILSDEKKADEWFDKMSAVNIPLLSREDLLKQNEAKKKKPWRYYHIVTVPAKGLYTVGKYSYRGYQFISNLAVPIALGAIVLQSPWLPILKLLLGKIL